MTRALVVVVFVLAGCAPPADVSPPPAPAPTVSVTTTTPVATTTTPVTTTTTAVTTTTTAVTTTTTTLPELVGLAIEPVTDAVSQPVLLLSPPSSARRFVVERTGTVRELGSDGSVVGEPYLDVRDRVNSSGIEQGLLGMAFHPDFARNGRLFAYYFYGPAATRLVEFTARPAERRVDPNTERLLLELEQPTVRHNGGMLEFGPDGMLYVSLGEGGAASTHAQNPDTLLAAILRIDVDGDDPYAIPPDNPFVAGGGAPEVWAYGLRNPWRFAIDAETNAIYIADVGHERIEEINVADLSRGGSNYGWLRMEGSMCFQRGCDPEAEDLVLPVHEYSHAEGCSVTGGRVYRGSLIPELQGAYLYSDWCGGWLRSFRWNGTEASDHIEWLTGLGQVNSFGVDSHGELYILTWSGSVGRIVALREG